MSFNIYTAPTDSRSERKLQALYSEWKALSSELRHERLEELSLKIETGLFDQSRVGFVALIFSTEEAAKIKEVSGLS